MLVYDLRDLTSTAAAVDDVLPADDPVWEEHDRVPPGGVHVTGRLSAAGPGRFYFSGHVRGADVSDCRRCLRGVETAVDERVQVLFAETGDDADDPDVFSFDPRTHELDMRPAVREQWLLAAPMYAQCREDCAGLCPSCGADLNAGPCGCEQPTDQRWAALRSMRHAGDSGGRGAGGAH